MSVADSRMRLEGAPRAALAEQSATVPRQPTAPSLRIAYLATEYPKVSHTFIRREILELERRGHFVLRLAIRSAGDAVADAADREEAARTVACLDLPWWRILASVVAVKAAHPLRWLGALGTAWRMSRASDRGLLRHIAYLWEAATLVRICRHEDVRHVHAHFGTNSAAVALLMKRLSGGSLTCSMTVHGPDEFDAPRGFALARKVAEAAFVIAISDFCSAQLKRWSDPHDWSKIHVVRCSVGPEFFERARPIPSGSRTLLSIGRLSAQKGQLLLVDAMRRLRAEGVDCRLVLAGDGELRGEIELAIDAARLSDRITITGWVDEAAVREHLLQARALVQPSFAEGLPVVMMEALAMRRPVVATAIAGVPELVRAGENGWLITAGSADELVDAMRAALAEPVERLDRMGDAGAQRVRERHSTATEVDKIESLLSAHLSRKEGA